MSVATRTTQANDRDMAVSFMNDVKKSLLFQYDWADLLSAAPLALSLMGSCYVASCSTDVAVSLEDSKPSGGFRFLKYNHLKPCLMQVSDTGAKAFITAELKMGLIMESCQPMNSLINQILEAIAELPHPAAADDLNRKLTFLQDTSNACYLNSKLIETTFDRWLDLVMELHQVTIAKYDTSTSIEQMNQALIAEQAAKLEATETAEKSAKEAAELMKAQLLTSQEAFKKASDNNPGPWEALGFTVAESLAKTLTTVVSQFASTLVPTPQAAGAPGLTPGASNPPPAKEAKDPAYVSCSIVSTHLVAMGLLLTGGADGGVDWTQVKATTTDTKSGLVFVNVGLTGVLETTKWTTAGPSTTLKAVVTSALQIAAELKAAAAKRAEISSVPPTAAEVRAWQDKLAGLKGQVLALETTAASLPGNTNALPGNLGAGATAPAGSAQGNSILAAAAETVKVTQAGYLQSQSNYLETSKQLIDTQLKLANIRGELAKLNLQNATLEEVKKILNQCMSLLADLKDQISKLVRFFGGISNMIEVVLKTHVRAIVDGSEMAMKVTLGGVSLLDYQKKNIYGSCLMVRCYFSLVKDIAETYTDVSIHYIMPGVQMCNELSKITTELPAAEQTQAIMAKNTLLNEYTDGVEAAVTSRVRTKQKTITGQLEQRATLIATQTAKLPPSTPAQTAAIQAGQQQSSAYQLADQQSSPSQSIIAAQNNFPGGFGDDE